MRKFIRLITAVLALGFLGGLSYADPVGGLGGSVGSPTPRP
jgi:hypothetical protein